MDGHTDDQRETIIPRHTDTIVWRGIKMAKLFANSGDPDQIQHYVVSDLGLHCLPITLLVVSRLQWVNMQMNTFTGI